MDYYGYGVGEGKLFIFMNAMYMNIWKRRQLEMIQAAGKVVRDSYDWYDLEGYVAFTRNGELDFVPVLHVGLWDKSCKLYADPSMARPKDGLIRGKCGFIDSVYDDVVSLVKGVKAKVSDFAIVFDQMGLEDKVWKKVIQKNFFNLYQSFTSMGLVCYWGIDKILPFDKPSTVIVIRLCSDGNVGEEVKRAFASIDPDYCPNFGVISLCRSLSKTETLKLQEIHRYKGARFEPR